MIALLLFYQSLLSSSSGVHEKGNLTPLNNTASLADLNKVQTMNATARRSSGSGSGSRSNTPEINSGSGSGTNTPQIESESGSGTNTPQINTPRVRRNRNKNTTSSAASTSMPWSSTFHVGSLIVCSFSLALLYV